MASRCEIAWAAGLFEGEGAIVLRSGKLHLQLKMCDRRTVERFSHAVGTNGRVLGPYSNKSAEKDGYPRSDFYVWTTRVGEVDEILGILWPWLSDQRQERALELGYKTRGIAA